MELFVWARTYRVLQRMSQEEMARELGISRQAYSTFENGQSQLRPLNARRLINLIGEPPEDSSAQTSNEPAAEYPARPDRLLLSPCPHCDQDVPLAYRGTDFRFCARCGKPLG